LLADGKPVDIFAKQFNDARQFARFRAVSEFVTSKQVSITLQGRGAGSGGGSP
jgi:hypothetical protein